ncbi:MAG: MBL fold metallo-hydrolase [Alphaproteobacteria bacterium]|nr:MBL fold metallo-hydrolase [Alphaproteobacteria bacterium]
MVDIFYVAEPSSWLFKKVGQKVGASGARQLLLGARLHVDPATETPDGWVTASTVPDDDNVTRSGFIELSRLSSRQQLKIFYTDVGQGDGTLIEAEGAIVIIDGGPNSGFANRLKKRLASLRRADQAIGEAPRGSLHINAIVISHFDFDHYNGLTSVLNNSDYTFGTIYHNGLPRYGEDVDKDLNLGTLSPLPDTSQAISTDLRGLQSAQKLLDDDLLLTESNKVNMFGKFLQAAIDASDQGRLAGFELLKKRQTGGAPMILPGTGDDLEFEVLAPLTTTEGGAIKLQAFPDPHDVSASNPHPTPSDSHTINGNSIVLRLTYGATTFLFGGDLNQPAQKYLAARYGGLGRFAADVNKACHHGSSDFDIDYVKAVNPLATVFSSGDNGSYDHPLPDAIGTAAKHSRGEFPLIFSTELARETGSKVKFGHINARSNGTVIVMAQKKEKPSASKTWYPFELPYSGPFPDHHD